jgi:hypothetical protein
MSKQVTLFSLLWQTLWLSLMPNDKSILNGKFVAEAGKAQLLYVNFRWERKRPSKDEGGWHRGAGLGPSRPAFCGHLRMRGDVGCADATVRGDIALGGSPLPNPPHKGEGLTWGRRLWRVAYTTTPVRLLDMVSLRSARSCWGERL